MNVTASQWIKHRDRMDTLSSSNHPLGGSRAELYWGHQTLRKVRSQGDSSGRMTPCFQGPPMTPRSDPTLPPNPQAILPLFPPAVQVWELALPREPSSGRSIRTKPLQSPALESFRALLPGRHLARGHLHPPPLLSSASQRCELLINKLYLPVPEKINRKIV